MGRKQQLRWTVLPQGFSEAPKVFGQALEGIMEKCKQKDTVTVLQYADSLLVAGAEQSDVEEETVKLLNYLGQQGLRVCRSKVQRVEKEVKYLRHLISWGSQRLSPERIAGIVKLPVPKTVREVRQFLGLVGFCHIWTEDYSTKVKFL